MNFREVIQKLSAVFGFEPEHQENSCQFAIDDAVVLLQEAGDKLLLIADLGADCPDDALFTRFLAANYAYQETSGSSFARDPETGHMMLQRYDWMDRLTPDMLVRYLEEFAGVALKWRDIITGKAAFESPEESAGAAVPEEAFDLQNFDQMV
ncbi:type III secretion system chaperone [Succinimonas sp.]|uniref:type III secretion system chaperone n=1 Tax=Succinimonas sp. TaxID=1936151 RepID=UPI00386777DA